MRFPRFCILVLIYYCIVNQKYFYLEGSCESHNLIEIPFEDIIYEMDHKLSTNPIVIVHCNMHHPKLFTKDDGIKLRGSINVDMYMNKMIILSTFLVEEKLHHHNIT